MFAIAYIRFVLRCRNLSYKTIYFFIDDTKPRSSLHFGMGKMFIVLYLFDVIQNRVMSEQLDRM